MCFFRYDAISGVPSVQRSVSLEKASILFNIGALYTQIGTRADRSHRRGIEEAIDAFQRSTGKVTVGTTFRWYLSIRYS